MMADEYFDSDQNNSQSSQRQNKAKFEAMFPPSNNLSSKPTAAAAAASDASQIKQQLASAEQGGEIPPPCGYYQNVKTKSKLILPTAIWVLIIVGGLCFLSLLSSLNKTLGTLDVLVEIEQKNHDQRKGENDEKISNDRIGNEQQVNSKAPFNENQLLPFADRLQTSDSDDFLHTWFSFPSWASLEPPFQRVHNNHKQLFSEISDQNKEQPFIHANIDKINININTPNNQDGQEVKKIPLPPLSELIFPTPQLLSDRLDFNSPPMSLEGSIVRPAMPFMRPLLSQSQDSNDHLIVTLEGSDDNGDQQRAPLLPSLPLNAPLREIHHNHYSGPQPNSPYELLVANGPQKPTIEDNLAESVAQSLFKVIEASNPDFLKPDFPLPPPREQSGGLIQPPYPSSAPSSPPAAPPSHSHRHLHTHLHSGPKPTTFPAPEPELVEQPVDRVAPIEVPLMPMESKPISLPLGDSIVFINGEPLIGDKKQSLSMDEDTQVPLIKEKDRNQVNDLFNLFFGPPPDSKLVVAQPHIVEPIEETIKKEQQPLNFKDEPSSSPLDQSIKVKLTTHDKVEDGNEKEESPIELASLFSHMFSMPQFGGPQAAQNINQPGRGKLLNQS